jgi:hypothetical protein
VERLLNFHTKQRTGSKGAGNVKESWIFIMQTKGSIICKKEGRKIDNEEKK